MYGFFNFDLTVELQAGVWLQGEGGRLVYWLPVIRQIYNSDLTPSNPCLSLVEDCEQVLQCVH